MTVAGSEMRLFNVTPFVLLLLVIAEAGFFTFFRNTLGIYASPVATAFVSLLIALLPLLNSSRPAKISPPETSRSHFASGWVVFVLGILFAAFKLHFIFSRFEINVESSDIIPAIHVYVQRLLSGQQVYSTFTELNGYHVEPNYLPLHWLPFVISKTLNFDPRWLAFSFLAIGIALYQASVFAKSSSLPEIIIKSALPHLVLLLFIQYEPEIFGRTVETLIAGYYLILFFSILSGSPVIKGIGILCCLLSRFSLVLWLPLYLHFLFKDDGKRTLKTVAIAAAGVLLIYIIPFLSQDWHSLARGYQNYSNATAGEWHPQSWQQPGEKPFSLFRGIGFASFFYDFAKDGVELKLLLLRKFHLLFSIAAVAAAAFYYFKKRPESKLFPLLALKFYFIFFFSFIQIPYTYLYLVPVFLSVFIASQLSFSKTREIGV